MNWTDFSKQTPKSIGLYLIHCIGINVPQLYQIAIWNGVNFVSVPGNLVYPFIISSGGQVIQSVSVDYYMNINNPQSA